MAKYQLYIRTAGKPGWHYAATFGSAEQAWEAQVYARLRKCQCKVMRAPDGVKVERVEASHG